MLRAAKRRKNSSRLAAWRAAHASALFSQILGRCLIAKLGYGPASLQCVAANKTSQTALLSCYGLCYGVVSVCAPAAAASGGAATPSPSLEEGGSPPLAATPTTMRSLSKRTLSWGKFGCTYW